MESRFGKYHIDRKVAVGGMAEIFQAHSTSGLVVAIKKIHPNLASEAKFVQMFLDEARIVMRLRHPNIVQMLDFGRIGGTYFFSMEWVDGKPLSDAAVVARDAGTPFPVDVALWVMMDVCAGLHYAHERRDRYDRPLKIVHRDVSPPNVMLTRQGLAKIADFGIADIREKSTQTLPGIIRGKFSYMSPEQARAEPLDRRSDVFSAGVVLYELLTATRLFLREKETDTIEAVRACRVPPIRPSSPDVSAALEEVVFRALAPNPEARYGTAKEFGKALRSILEREYPVSDRTAVTRFLKRLFPQEEFAGAETPLPAPSWTSSGVVVTELGRRDIPGWLSAHRRLLWVAMGLAAVLLAELWVRAGQRVLARLR